jgi:dTMP kinase
MFIVIEGVDGSGKSSAVNHMINYLQINGVTCHHLVFPDRSTPTGIIINQFLKGEIEVDPETLHLLFAANRREKKVQIQKWQEQGDWIICDRYWYSGAAYSSAHGINMGWCTNVDKGLHDPDILVFIDITPVKSLERVVARDGEQVERYENLEFQNKVYKNYQDMLKFYFDRKKTQLVLIDGTLPKSEMLKDILTNTIVR